MDELWNLFFETGFVYPKKYAQMCANKEKFKETYERLYNNNPNIAKHFVVQDRNIIQGHISMLRVYENTWLFHHHMSRSINNKAGILVLEQIGRYVNDFYRLHSTGMNFVISYFRLENRFPHRIFGGFERHLNDPKGCSLDSFAFFRFPGKFEALGLTGINLAKTQPEDLLELKSFYEYRSGGLMLKALDLEPDMIYCDNLNKEYEKAGFKRERHLFSLKKEGYLKAIIMVTISDFGLNLSNLANCIHVIVMDGENISGHEIISSLSMLSRYCAHDEIPILLYPSSYAQSQYIPHEKIYDLWVLNVPHSGEYYLKHVDNLINRFY
jgi:hypothetical protein